MSSADDHAAFIERVRRSGIRIDREGVFWHEGARVEHNGLRQALFRWLDRLPDPDRRFILRLDANRFAYVDVDDTPLVVTSLRWQPSPSGEVCALLGLNDGSEEPLDPQTLTVDAEGVLRCTVRGGRLPARLATSAAATLAERIEQTAAGPHLRLAGAAALIAPR